MANSSLTGQASNSAEPFGPVGVIEFMQMSKDCNLDVRDVPTRPRNRRSFAVWGAVALSTFVAACGGPQIKPTTPSGEVTHLDMEPVQITATNKDGQLQVDAYDAEELFDRASQAYSQKKLDEAFSNYEQLLKTFAQSPQAKAAKYNLGLVLQDKTEWAKAAQQFQSFIDAYPDTPDAKDAYFQMGISLAEAKDWAGSEKVFIALADRKDLTADDRVEALTRRAVARFNLEDLDTAEYVLKEVFFYKRRLEATNEERLETDYFLALAQLMLGEISHKRSNTVALRWPEPQMKKDLEEKAKQLLEARRRYIDAVRYGNPRIASMAAYQIGMLFQEFYDQVMAVPPPQELGAAGQSEERGVYKEELRAKLRIVLEKALRGHEHNIELFERLGVETEWVTKSRSAIDRLRQLLEQPVDVANPAPPPAAKPEPAPPNLDNAAPERRPPADNAGGVRRIL